MTYLIILGWIICGVLSTGITFAYFQSSFPSIAESQKREDLANSILISFGGPLSLLVSFFLSGFAKHGIKFK